MIIPLIYEGIAFGVFYYAILAFGAISTLALFALFAPIFVVSEPWYFVLWTVPFVTLMVYLIAYRTKCGAARRSWFYIYMLTLFLPILSVIFFVILSILQFFGCFFSFLVGGTILKLRGCSGERVKISLSFKGAARKSISVLYSIAFPFATNGEDFLFDQVTTLSNPLCFLSRVLFALFGILIPLGISIISVIFTFYFLQTNPSHCGYQTFTIYLSWGSLIVFVLILNVGSVMKYFNFYCFLKSDNFDRLALYFLGWRVPNQIDEPQISRLKIYCALETIGTFALFCFSTFAFTSFHLVIWSLPCYIFSALALGFYFSQLFVKEVYGRTNVNWVTIALLTTFFLTVIGITVGFSWFSGYFLFVLDSDLEFPFPPMSRLTYFFNLFWILDCFNSDFNFSHILWQDLNSPAYSYIYFEK